MVYLNIPKRSNLSESEHGERMRSVGHLLHASHDINQWKFEQFAPSDWMARSCDHVYEGRCKVSGIRESWMIDIVEADVHGSFERRHNEIIEHFTQSLIYLDEWKKEFQQRLALAQSGVFLPDSDINLEHQAKLALHRGDHPNSLV